MDIESRQIMSDLLGFIAVIAIMVAIGYWGFKE
jgi:hypothetical protein